MPPLQAPPAAAALVEDRRLLLVQRQQFIVDGELLLLSLKELALSSGSACTSAAVEPSYVLRGIGLSDELAHSSIRLSLGRYTSLEDVQRAAQVICQVVPRLRAS